MLAAAKEAQSFIVGKSEDDLTGDRQLTLALLKCIEIIGEAAARVGEDTRSRNPGLPWTDIIGMRNRLVHAYFDIDLGLLWTTLTADLPGLVRELEQILEDS
jgi:uncharacterized protein with HEPN domain